jgi:purine-nucleoside phosphorylase
MINLNLKYQNLINELNSLFHFSPDMALILGSGLGDFTKKVTIIKSINTSNLPGYPISTITGHEGKIHHAKFHDKNLLIFQGRIHPYEGYHISECILPIFISKKLNSKYVLLTNAAGGINPLFKPGDLMLIDSFNSISIKKELTELIGISSLEGKNNFLKFPSSSFNESIKNAAIEEKINLKEGNYWYTKGPSYETPAEIKMIAKFGGDAVGMSTVHEAVYSSYLGMKTASVSCITNYAAGISETKLNHAEVTETANKVKEKFERLVKRIISIL